MNLPEQFSLKDKVAIVTGSSAGIGKAIAYALGTAGAHVVVSSRKNESVEQVVSEFKEEGISASGVAAHVGKEEDLERLVHETTTKYKRLDVIVNNAAANPEFGPMLNSSKESFTKIMEVNVQAPLELVKKAYPYLKHGGGSIINISSVGGLTPEPQLGVYSVSKAALISMTKVMAKELGRDGIRANVICPGLIKTKFSETLWKNKTIASMVLQKLALPRFGESVEIGSLALFLASDAGSYCTGGVYTADGGYTI
jgi:NAD(P)-dependent dehydrogenase (short-subunit alcohol dehydrogenase family)